MQSSRQYTFIQNYRHAKSRKYKAKQKLHMGTLEIDWKKVTVTFNENKINFPRFVTIKLQDKIKVTWVMKRKPLLFHLMLKQGIMWFK